MDKKTLGLAACLALAAAHLSCTGLHDILWDEREISAFSFSAADNGGRFPDTDAVIEGGTILLTLPEGTPLSNLVARFSHRGYEVRVAGVAQTSGVSTNDFSEALEYRVFAENGAQRTYRVTVAYGAPLSSSNELLAFAFPRALHPALPADAPGLIDGTNVSVVLSVDVDPRVLVAVFTTSGTRVEVGGLVQTSAVTTNDFSEPLAYHVIAADGSRRVYRVALDRHEFSGGSGTPADPYLVGSAAELDRVRNYPGAHFRQITDISLAGFANWVPIGTQAGPFTGSFDGNGYVIDDLVIDVPAQDVQGLFGAIHGATLQSITVTNAVVNARSHAGILVGIALTNSIIDGCCTAGTLSGKTNAGGLIGQIRGASTVSASSSSASVAGIRRVGGLVGLHLWSGEITRCFATGDVTATDASTTALHQGGLVGLIAQGASVNNCYATGNVTGVYLAALIGGADVGGAVTNCFATGRVLGSASPWMTPWPRGIICQNASTTVGNCFWDNQTVQPIDASGGGSPKTTAEMFQQATYAGWDFTTVWMINEGLGYPMLR